jgi:hypothetical protein
MKKYLREIKASGIILMFIGIVLYRFMHFSAGIWACIIGILLWLTEVVYKAFCWQEYRRDNMQNIAMMLIIIVLLFITMIMRA